jgi:hypothetical protein
VTLKNENMQIIPVHASAFAPLPRGTISYFMAKAKRLKYEKGQRPQENFDAYWTDLQLINNDLEKYRRISRMPLPLFILQPLRFCHEV